jgi:hypothetical protein
MSSKAAAAPAQATPVFTVDSGSRPYRLLVRGAQVAVFTNKRSATQAAAALNKTEKAGTLTPDASIAVIREAGGTPEVKAPAAAGRTPRKAAVKAAGRQTDGKAAKPAAAKKPSATRAAKPQTAAAAAAQQATEESVVSDAKLDSRRRFWVDIAARPYAIHDANEGNDVVARHADYMAVLSIADGLNRGKTTVAGLIEKGIIAPEPVSAIEMPEIPQDGTGDEAPLTKSELADFLVETHPLVQLGKLDGVVMYDALMKHSSKVELEELADLREAVYAAMNWQRPEDVVTYQGKPGPPLTPNAVLDATIAQAKQIAAMDAERAARKRMLDAKLEARLKAARNAATSAA